MSEKLAEELKLVGNQCFSQGKYGEAIKHYSASISVDPSNAILYSNRAMANLKLKNYFEAEQDSSSAIVLDPSFGKAYYRLGLARKELKKIKSALKSFEMSAKLSPNNVEIEKQCEALRKLIENDVEIRIDPILKKKTFQSTMPLKKIEIKNLDVQPMPSSNVDKFLSNFIEKLTMSHVPKSYKEFEKDWRELSSTTVDYKVKYLEHIDIKSLENVFSFPFDPKLLFEVIQVLSISQKYCFVVEVLEIISKMPRLELNISFFEENENEVLKTLFLKLLYVSIPLDEELFVSLAKKFMIKL